MNNEAGGSDMEGRDTFLDGIILSHAQTAPTKTAIIYQGEHVTYQALAARVNCFCSFLSSAGVGEGDFAIVLLPPCADITIALLAIHRLGAIYAPLDPEHPDVQLKARCADLDPACVITTEENQNRVQGWSKATVTVEKIQDEPAGKVELAASARNSEAPACIFFTSGTTGEPKGVLGSFRAMRESITSPVRFLGINESDTLNSIARYAWSISMLELLAPLVVGGTSLILDRSQALNLNWLKENAGRCTAFHCPPALLRKLADHIGENCRAEEYPSGVRLVWYGGDVFSAQHIDKLHKVFPNAQIGTAYGCTEIFGLSHCYLYPRGQAVKKVLVGRPVDSIKQKILRDDGQPAREREEGQIFLAGPRVAMEYWRQPRLTAQKFVDIDGECHYATGDYGRLDHGGNLEFLQRRDSQVKIRGIRIELGEIEYHLNNLPAAKETVVLAVEKEAGEKELRAYVVASPDAGPTADELRGELEKNLPDYMIPARIFILDAFPVTENFKVDKKALAKYEPRTQEGEFESEAARKVAAIWKRITGRLPENLDSNFFKSGGDSLSAAQLAALLGREFGRTVEVAEVYRAPVFKAQLKMFETEPVAQVVHANNQGGLFATQAQKGLIFRELLENKHSSITCTRYIRREDGFDSAIVRKALVQLIERFPTLITHIRFDRREIKLVEEKHVDEDAIEVILNHGVWTLEPGRKNSLVKASQKFDLKKDPLIKAMINGMEDGSQVLQLTAHHIAADDNSMGRLAGDFIEIHDALLKGRQVNLPPVQQDYREFANEQYERMQSGFYTQRAEDIGRRLLDNLPLCLDSPLLDLKSWVDHQAISTDMAVPEKLAYGHKLSFTEYVAALSWAIYRHFGRSHMVLCAHVALRRDAKQMPRVGMFVNLLPLFTGANPEHTPMEHVLRTQNDLDEAMSRSDVPYELILSGQRDLKKLGRFPFDAFVNELRFDNTYPPGYEDVVVPRAFATDTNEISMSLVRSTGSESIKLECPAVTGARETAEHVGNTMLNFVASLVAEDEGD